MNEFLPPFLRPDRSRLEDLCQGIARGSLHRVRVDMLQTERHESINIAIAHLRSARRECRSDAAPDLRPVQRIRIETGQH